MRMFYQHPHRGRFPRATPTPLVLAMLLVACQTQPLASGGPVSEAALLQRIEAEVGQAACSSSAECRTLPIGGKACGGPVRWMAWSTTASRADRLQGWAQDLAQQQRQREAAAGIASTCSIVGDPGASCDAGRCMLARGPALR